MLALHSQQSGSLAIERARSFIEDHSDEELSLAAVTRVVNMSATYFSEKFKKATDINFVDYVARTELEKLGFAIPLRSIGDLRLDQSREQRERFLPAYGLSRFYFFPSASSSAAAIAAMPLSPG